MQRFIQTLLEAEVSELLGQGKYERRRDRPSYHLPQDQGVQDPGVTESGTWRPREECRVSEETPSLDERLMRIAKIDNHQQVAEEYRKICIELGACGAVVSRNDAEDRLQEVAILYRRIERRRNLLEQQRIADSAEASARAAETSAQTAAESGHTARRSMWIAFAALVVSIVLATLLALQGCREQGRTPDDEPASEEPQ